MVGLYVGAVTNKKQGTVGVKLEPSPLRLPTLHSGSSPALPCKVHKDVQFSGNI